MRLPWLPQPIFYKLVKTGVSLARAYTYLNSRKKPSPFHIERVSRWFSIVSSVKALIIKPSQHSHFKTCISHTVPLPSLCKTRSLQKKTSLKRRQPFWETVNFFQETANKKAAFFSWKVSPNRKVTVNACEYLKTSSLHTWNVWKSMRNTLCVKGWRLFSEF